MRIEFQSLESRVMLSAVAPTDEDQYMVQLMNRARANPTAEAATDGIDLNEGLAPGTISPDPKQPLAINFFLDSSANEHTQWMLDNQLFQHAGDNGSDPGERMASAGYAFIAPYLWAENLAWSGTTGTPNFTSFVQQEHHDLFVDSGIDGRGHRTNLLLDDLKEVGVGIMAGQFNGYNAIVQTDDFAYSGPDSFVTGVAYRDLDNDQFYTPGEGLGGLTITATNASDSSVAGTTTTFSSGGYSLKLPPGTYTVSATGGSLSSPIVFSNVTIADKNIEVDFVPAASNNNGGGTDGDHGGSTGGSNTISASFSGKLPTSLKPAQSAKVAVSVTNVTSTAINSPTPLSLYLSGDQSLDANDLQVATASIKKITAGKSGKASFSFKSPLTLPDGNYYLILSGSDGQLATSTSTTHVIAPTANFSLSMSKLKKSYSTSSKIPLSVKVKNTGNYTASAGLVYSIGLRSTDGGADISLGASNPIAMTLKSNGSGTYKTSVTLPADLPAGSYQFVITLSTSGLATAETSLDDNTVSSSAFLVQP